MALSLVNYLKNIESALEVTTCIRKFGSVISERQEKPEIELKDVYKAKRDFKGENYLMNNIYLTRSPDEYCLIEPSINSVRVGF